jgi:hypothetical protein
MSPVTYNLNVLPGTLPDVDFRVLDHVVRSLFDAGDVVSRIFGRQNEFVERKS